ncbi:MAG TPA: hypothetical protein VFL16_04135 [Steroidobacteraceae bacterium]|nr:hypothetical protein [Steroidobacteraceae bacterium]
MRTLVLAAFLLIALALGACGGGGGGAASTPSSGSGHPSSAANPAPVDEPAPVVDSGDLDLAGRIYQGDERTPDGFQVETRPSNVVGTLSTRHLKNTDLASGQQAMGPTYEMCTNDMAQAIDWSERQASWQGQYSDLAEVRSDAHMFELIRVPRADVTAMIRHRVFRCDYLDRSGSDLHADAGAAGSMNQRPLTAGELKDLAEYLWQFTMFNNSDYAVQSSSGSTSGGNLVHTIRLGQLVRGSNGACDTLQVSDWTHTMNSVDGTLTRALTPVRSISVRKTSAGVEACN